MRCVKHLEQELTKSGCFRCWQEKEKPTGNQILKPMDNDIKIVKTIEILRSPIAASQKTMRALRLLENNFE
jgi:hypothetical protein